MEVHVQNVVLLPRRILNHLICSKCLHYLSVGPVMIYPGNKSVCGRCIGSYEHQEELAYSLFNKLSTAFMFRCINSYDGCTEMLSHAETKNHEAICTFKKLYHCLECLFYGNGCQFVQHYEILHQERVAKNGVFRLASQNTEEKLVYVAEDFIIVINLQIKDGKMTVYCSFLNPLRYVKRYTLRFFKQNFKIEYVSDPINFVSSNGQPKTAELLQLDLCELENVFSYGCYFGVIIIKQDDTIDFSKQSSELKQKYQWDLSLKQKENVIDEEKRKWLMEKVKFSNCHETLKKLIDIYFRARLACFSCDLEIFLYPQSHVACSSCLKSYCPTCKTECSWISSREIVKDVELTCDWKKCSKTTPIWEFLFHKQVCEKRQYACPMENCNFSGIKMDLKKHWHSRDTLLKFGESVDFYTDWECEIYWIVDNLNEMLIIKVSSDNNTFYLNVSEELVIYPYNYKLELRYYHTTQFCYKVTAELSQNCNKKTYYYGLNRNEDFRLVLKFD